jgi:Pyruvate/2-oxoacid:ferredoxin oxidoreductase delta subunit
MKRKILSIDESKCNGCGNCVPGCPEGALRIINGKARLVNDLFCDGLGACIGECPEGAIKIEEREAEPYSESAVMENIVKQGIDVVQAHLEHLRDHGETGFLKEAVNYLKNNGIRVPDGFETKGLKPLDVQQFHGCPGSSSMDFTKETRDKDAVAHKAPSKSELRQWPVQLHLLNPAAQYFSNADLLIAADCVPFAYPDFHRTLLKNRVLIILCPKLDEGIDRYIEKLAEIFRTQNIRSVTIAHMEVPCCFGVGKIVDMAMTKAGVRINIQEYTVSIRGEIEAD